MVSFTAKGAKGKNFVVILVKESQQTLSPRWGISTQIFS